MLKKIRDRFSEKKKMKNKLEILSEYFENKRYTLETSKIKVVVNNKTYTTKNNLTLYLHKEYISSEYGEVQIKFDDVIETGYKLLHVDLENKQKNGFYYAFRLPEKSKRYGAFNFSINKRTKSISFIYREADEIDKKVKISFKESKTFEEVISIFSDFLKKKDKYLESRTKVKIRKNEDI